MGRNKHKNNNKNGNRNPPPPHHHHHYGFYYSAPASLPDHYQVLGVSPDASSQEIKSAFRRLARETHPDKLNANDHTAKYIRQQQEKFKKVNEAYRTLSDDRKRHEYDQQRLRRHREQDDSMSDDYDFGGKYNDDDDDDDDDDGIDWEAFFRSQSARDSGRASSSSSAFNNRRSASSAPPGWMFRLFLFSLRNLRQISWLLPFCCSIFALIFCCLADGSPWLVYTSYVALSILVYYAAQWAVTWCFKRFVFYFLENYVACW